MQSGYFVGEEQVRGGLAAAVRRGVDVKVMVPGKHIDIPVVRMASRLHYGDLLEGGVKIYEYTDTMLHNKTAIVDGIFSTVGSINFDPRTKRLNAGDRLAIYDRAFAERKEAIFDAALPHCQHATYEPRKKRRLP